MRIIDSPVLQCLPLVEVDTETCRVGPNKDGGIGHVLDSSEDDGAFDIWSPILNKGTTTIAAATRIINYPVF